MISSARAQDRPAGAKDAPVTKGGATQAPAELDRLNAAIKSKQEHITKLETTTRSAPGWWTTTSAMTMSATVLVFGFFTLCLAAYVIRRGHHWEAVQKIFGMVLIIVLTVFLIVAGYDDKQIAPAIGLLGTIAGYLLGKETTKPEKPATTTPTSSASTPPIGATAQPGAAPGAPGSAKS